MLMARTGLALILTSVLLITSACGRASPNLGSSPSPQVGFSAPITLVFMAAPMNSYRFWQELIRGFEADNPTIHIELRYQQIPADWYEQADVMLGSMPVDAPWQDLSDRGQLLDLKPFLDTDPSFGAADFLPGMLNLYRREQGVWGIPLDISVSVLVYNESVFQSSGTPRPTTDWTWTDVWAAAQRLKRAGQCQSSFTHPFSSRQAAFGWWAERNEGLYQLQSGKAIPVLDTAALRQGIAEYLASGEMLDPADAAWRRFPTSSEALAQLSAGQSCFATLSLSVWMRESARYPALHMIPLPPGRQAAQQAIEPGYSLFISAGTVHPEAAWRWLRFVSQQDLKVAQWGQLAARRSVAEHDQSGSWWSPDSAQVAYTTLEKQANYLAVSPEAEIIYDALNQALASIQTEEDITVALAKAQQQAEAQIAARQARQKRATPAPFTIKTPTKQGAVSINFQVLAAEELYRTAATAFTQEQPEWQVNIVAQGPDTAGDCIAGYVDGGVLATAFLSTALADMTPFFEADSRWTMQDFFPQASAVMTWQGAHYLLPLSIKPLALGYNPTIFDKLGLAAPDASWTVETILQTAETIQSAQADYVGYVPSPEATPFLLAQQEISLLTSGRPLQPRFTEPDVMAAVMRLQRLGLAGEANRGGMYTGQTAMWLNLFDSFPGAPVMPGAATTPIRLRSGTALPIYLGVGGITRVALQPVGCWEWLNFLAQRGIRPRDELPALRQAAEAEAQRPGPDQALYQSYLGALQDDTAVSTTTLAEEGALWWFVTALRSPANRDLASALQTAQDKAEAFLACLGPAGENDLDRAAQCARQVDPAHPLAQIQR